MKDTQLTMSITLTVSGGEGWAARLASGLDGISVLLHETTLMSAKGDGNDYSFEYKISTESANPDLEAKRYAVRMILEKNVGDTE